MVKRSNVPPEGQVSVQVWMHRELRNALKRLAIERDSSVSEIVRQLAEAELARAGAKP